MKAELVPPAALSLRHAIVDYAFVEGEGMASKIIRPRTGAVLSVRLAGSVDVDDHAVPEVTVTGVHERPFSLAATHDRVDLVRVQFAPGGLRYFSRVSAATLRERSVSAEWMFPVEAVSALVKELRSSSELESRIAALDRFFTSLYSPPGGRDLMVLELVERLARETTSDASAVLENAPVGVRQFQRLFSFVIGFSPRKYLQISRFERAEREVLSVASASFADVALEAGYYDQAHFNRDFKRFASMPPSSYHFCASP